MEPRPHERGKRGCKYGIGENCLASMEPRPHERGKLERAIPKIEVGGYASMEPRPHERGKPFQPRRQHHAQSSFNGATSSRTWKENEFSIAKLEMRSFNGATSSRTWKGETTRLRSKPRNWLQWSHVLTNVESWLHGETASANKRLQWSHVLTNVERGWSYAVLSPLDASMEPRPHERGKLMKTGAFT